MGTTQSYFKKIVQSTTTIFEGLAITFSNLLRKPSTVQYPEVKVRELLPPRYRGFLEVDTSICIGCLNCSKSCPIDVIDVNIEKDGKQRYITRFNIDLSKCMFCGICVEQCNPGSIRFSRHFEASTESIDTLVFRFVGEDERVPVAKLKKDGEIETRPMDSIAAETITRMRAENPTIFAELRSVGMHDQAIIAPGYVPPPKPVKPPKPEPVEDEEETPKKAKAAKEKVADEQAKDTSDEEKPAKKKVKAKAAEDKPEVAPAEAKSAKEDKPEVAPAEAKPAKEDKPKEAAAETKPAKEDKPKEAATETKPAKEGPQEPAATVAESKPEKPKAETKTAEKKTEEPPDKAEPEEKPAAKTTESKPTPTEEKAMLEHLEKVAEQATSPAATPDSPAPVTPAVPPVVHPIAVPSTPQSTADLPSTAPQSAALKGRSLQQRTEIIERALAGTDAAQCGYNSCIEYARALATGDETDLTKCKPGGEETVEALKAIFDK